MDFQTATWPDAVMCLGLVAGLCVCVFFMAKYVWGPCPKEHVKKDEPFG